MTPISGEALYTFWKTARKGDGSTYSRREVATVFGLSEGQAGGRIYRYQQTLKGTMPPETPEAFNVSLADAPPFAITGDVVIVGDVHVPCTDYDMASRVGMIAERFGIDTLIIAGDLFNNDYASRHEKRTVHTTSFTQELNAARILMAEWLGIFKDIYFIAGNHDRWFTGKNDGWASMKDLLSMVTQADNVHVSEYGHMKVTSGGQQWLIAHGSNYSVNTLAVASEVANKEQGNTWLQHQHHCAKGWDRYKNYLTVDGPALVDPEKLAYVKMDVSKSAGMAVGFGVLRNGSPYLFGQEPFTDWGFWIGGSDDA